MPILRRPVARATSVFIEVLHDGDCFGIEVRRNPSARRLILRVRGATRDAILTIPHRTSMADAKSFAERQAAWVGVRLRRLPQTVFLESGATISVRGISSMIVSRPYSRGTVWTEPLSPEAGGAQQALCVAGDPAHLERRVLDFLKRECKADLSRAVSEYAARVGKPQPAITIRDTTSRWGSCTSSGRLNFSWRLIMAPPFVLSYLAAHEVCHLVHMNHSDRFWSLCRSMNADTDRAEAWLSAHGANLHRFQGKA